MTTLHDAIEHVHQSMVHAAAQHGAEVRDFSFTLARDGLLLTVSQAEDPKDPEPAPQSDHVLKVRPAGDRPQPYMVVVHPTSGSEMGVCSMAEDVKSGRVAFVDAFTDEVLDNAHWGPETYGDYVVTRDGQGNIVVGEQVNYWSTT